MGDSMLVYSEKMRRISRNRFQQGPSVPPQPVSNITKNKQRLLVNEADDDIQSGKPIDRKPGRPLRSLSDAASYKSLRGRHLLKPKKKSSLDMTGTDINITNGRISVGNKHCGVISSAWEDGNCVYQRQRKRGVTVTPKLEGLAINDNSGARFDPEDPVLPDISIPFPSSTSPRAYEQLGVTNFNMDDSRGVKCRTNMAGDMKTKYNLFKSGSRPWHSEQSFWTDIGSGRVCPESSEISQIVLKSFADDRSNSPESPVPEGKFSDTSAAELKLLQRNRKRLSSSSAPTSPVQSSDEEDDDSVRMRTQSVSLPCKPLKSVLKKPNMFAKKKSDASNTKSVSFKTQDRIRVISRCSGADWEALSSGGAFQSRSTIVVISD